MFEFEALVPVDFLCRVVLVDDGPGAVQQAIVNGPLVDDSGIGFHVAETGVAVR